MSCLRSSPLLFTSTGGLTETSEGLRAGSHRKQVRGQCERIVMVISKVVITSLSCRLERGCPSRIFKAFRNSARILGLPISFLSFSYMKPPMQQVNIH